jgi:hypothetical protein
MYHVQRNYIAKVWGKFAAANCLDPKMLPTFVESFIDWANNIALTQKYSPKTYADVVMIPIYNAANAGFAMIDDCIIFYPFADRSYVVEGDGVNPKVRRGPKIAKRLRQGRKGYVSRINFAEIVDFAAKTSHAIRFRQHQVIDVVVDALSKDSPKPKKAKPLPAPPQLASDDSYPPDNIAIQGPPPPSRVQSEEDE